VLDGKPDCRNSTLLDRFGFFLSSAMLLKLEMGKRMPLDNCAIFDPQMILVNERCVLSDGKALVLAILDQSIQGFTHQN
jgi:hypothetical protein